MPRVAPVPCVATPEVLATYQTSLLLLSIAGHAASCFNRCDHCRSWLAEIDRRIPPRAVVPEIPA